MRGWRTLNLKKFESRCLVHRMFFWMILFFGYFWIETNPIPCRIQTGNEDSKLPILLELLLPSPLNPKLLLLQIDFAKSAVWCFGPFPLERQCSVFFYYCFCAFSYYSSNKIQHIINSNRPSVAPVTYPFARFVFSGIWNMKQATCFATLSYLFGNLLRTLCIER